MKKQILIRFGLVFIGLALIGQLEAQSLSWTGYVRNYMGVLLQNENEYSIIQNTVNLNLELSKNEVAFKVNPYIYQYPGLQPETGLREAYLDIYLNSIDFRIGKQQIIWGKADGVFITDIISPKDLSEFLLRDFDEIRMGVTAVKADYYFGNNTFELVWIPQFAATKMPAENSIWSPKMDFPIQPVIDNSRRQVAATLQNSEIFAKLSGLTSALDFEIMAGYMWDDDPTLYMAKTLDPQSLQLNHLTITPEHKRLGLAGGSFSTTLKGFVVRGEGAFYTGKHFATNSTSLASVFVEKNYFHYLLGLDFTLWDIHMSSQFIQQMILDYETTIIADERENTLTFLATRDFLRETLHAELFAYIGLNNSDALIRPRIRYNLTDAFELLLGANIFLGDEGRFGQYHENDMVYTKIKYSF